MLRRYTETQRAQLDARPTTRKLQRTTAGAAAGAAASTAAGLGSVAGGGGASGGGGRPVVSVCVCTTSRNTDFNTLGELAPLQPRYNPVTTPLQPRAPRARPHTHTLTRPLTPLTAAPSLCPLYTPSTPSTPPLHPLSTPSTHP